MGQAMPDSLENSPPCHAEAHGYREPLPYQSARRRARVKASRRMVDTAGGQEVPVDRQNDDHPST